MNNFTQLDELLAQINGVTGVYAAPLSGGPALERHADRAFALASVSKLPLMIHLFRLADQELLDLSARHAVLESERVAGSGLLQYLDAGSNLTLTDLIRLMMMISDNMATDQLLSYTTKQAVEHDMHALGFTSVRMPHSIREMLGSYLPDGPNTPYEQVRAYFKDPNRVAPTDAAGGDPARGDAATPRDLAAMLTALVNGELLSPASTDLAVRILKDCQTNSRIPARLPKGTEVGHKTGTLNQRTNDAGVVFAPSGAFSLVLMNHGEDDEAKASATLAQAALLIYERFEAGW